MRDVTQKKRGKNGRSSNMAPLGGKRKRGNRFFYDYSLTGGFRLILHETEVVLSHVINFRMKDRI